MWIGYETEFSSLKFNVPLSRAFKGKISPMVHRRQRESTIRTSPDLPQWIVIFWHGLFTARCGVPIWLHDQQSLMRSADEFHFIGMRAIPTQHKPLFPSFWIPGAKYGSIRSAGKPLIVGPGSKKTPKRHLNAGKAYIVQHPHGRFLAIIS
mmetsp:Transcript_47377/g.81468  ORF Transcript_47377/g.81468 Transcript_47377/m.81468 type:complete len:151 (+) Transcript_47377:1327-1779(+)